MQLRISKLIDNKNARNYLELAKRLKAFLLSISFPRRDNTYPTTMKISGIFIGDGYNLIKKILIIFTFFFLCVPPLKAEDLFEGAITFQMTQGNKKFNMKYMSQGLRMRTEVATGPAGMSIALADYSKNKIYILMPQLQSYMESEFDPKNLGAKVGDATKDTTIEPTSEEEDILGYKCKKWITHQNGKTSDIWIAKGIGKFFEPMTGSANSSGVDAWKEVLSKEGGFPFRVIQKSPDGKEFYRLEVTKVEKMALDSKLFEVPAGYKKFDMPTGLTRH